MVQQQRSSFLAHDFVLRWKGGERREDVKGLASVGMSENEVDVMFLSPASRRVGHGGVAFDP